MTQLIQFAGRFLPAYFILIMIPACHRSSQPDPTPNPILKTGKLLRRIDWSGGVISTFTYNPDSSLNQRQDRNDSRGGYIQYIWNDGRLAEHFEEASIYTNKYEYNTQNQLTRMVRQYAELPITGGYELSFRYHANGIPSELHYSQLHEGGKKLVYRSVYNYTSANELARVTTYDEKNIKRFLFTIETYSASCNFLPWVFISSNLHPLYMIYNLPVLSRMNKIPGSILQTQFNPGGSVHSETRFQNTATITNEHIENLIMETRYPSNPAADLRTTGHFIY